MHPIVLLEKANDLLANYQKQIVNKSLTKFITKLVTKKASNLLANWKCLKSLEEIKAYEII